MRRRRLRWYVFGAQAAVAYGRPRMTADVDVTVDLAQTSTLTLVDDLSRAGFDRWSDPWGSGSPFGALRPKPRMYLGDDFLREARLLPLVHRPTGMPIDVVIAASSLHTEFLDRRRLIALGGVRVPMISPEDLVVTKVLAGRPKDLEDVSGVLLEQTDLDLERIRGLLGELEAALGEDRLLRRLERLIRKARTTVVRRQ
ncbi:DUF6036 family nucleotidyltransferase [Sorangium sp. So ce321]|uniref:DUF6036 family nucleotidyltransferase n=1 Tax=Sorangium sp. So ce321 TaxID=3133300 RepID=UPI003F604D37